MHQEEEIKVLKEQVRELKLQVAALERRMTAYYKLPTPNIIRAIEKPLPEKDVPFIPNVYEDVL